MGNQQDQPQKRPVDEAGPSRAADDAAPTGILRQDAAAPTAVQRLPQQPATRSLHQNALLRLQRTFGNQRVQRMLARRQTTPVSLRAPARLIQRRPEKEVEEAYTSAREEMTLAIANKKPESGLYPAADTAIGKILALRTEAAKEGYDALRDKIHKALGEYATHFKDSYPVSEERDKLIAKLSGAGGTKPARANFKKGSDLLKMPLTELHKYALEQADWHAGPDVHPVTHTPSIRAALMFARQEDMLAGCGKMTPDALVRDGLIDKSTAVLSPSKYQHIKYYNVAVNKSQPSVEIKEPTDNPDKAVKWGQALQKLVNAPGLGGELAKQIFNQQSFEKLVEKGWVDDFINFIATCVPRLEAPDGVEVSSYLTLREKVNPVDYAGSNLKGRIRSFHRFDHEALEALKRNFAAKGLEDGKRKPLTLILHATHDHNGAFHHDPKLTEVITNTAINTLMIEGAETLAAIQGELAGLAADYGRGGKIDQVMFAGHGNNRSIELAAPAVDPVVTAIKDHDTGDEGDLVFKKGEKIKVSTFDAGLAGWGAGSVGDRSGFFQLSYVDIPTGTITESGAINLDTNKDKSKDLFDELLKHMADDPSVAPHRRIVFNACLTNSNVVAAKLTGDVQTMQQTARDNIEPSLATYLQERTVKKGLKSITVLGANGSIAQVELIDKGTNALDIVTKDDPEVTNQDKLEYVKAGTEPQGVMRAALECWSGRGGKDAMQIEARRQACLLAVKERIKKPTPTWSHTVIKALFQVVDANPDDGELLRRLGDPAHALNTLELQSEARVHELTSNGLGPGGKLATHAPGIFSTLEADGPNFSKQNYKPLVIYEVWMKHAGAVASKFLPALAPFNCQTADEFLDVEFIDDAPPPTFTDLLPSGMVDAQRLLLAFRTVDKIDKHAHAVNYLQEIVDKTDNKRFPPALNVGDILKGNPSEEKLMGKIDRAEPPKTKDTTLIANMDLDGDGVNETYVESLTLSGKTKEEAAIYDRPDPAAASRNPNLKKEESVFILGKSGDFYAFEYRGIGGTRTSFLKKDQVAV